MRPLLLGDEGGVLTKADRRGDLAVLGVLALVDIERTMFYALGGWVTERRTWTGWW